MAIFSFDGENQNAFTQKYQKEINFTYHVNQLEFPIFHSHLDYWEFTLVTKGSLINQVDNKNYLYETNCLFITPTDVNHRILRNKKDTRKLQYLNIIFRERKIKQICDSFYPGCYNKLRNTESIVIPKNIVYMCDEIVHQIRLLKDGEIDRYEELILSIVLLLLYYIIFDAKNDKQEKNWADKFLKLTQDPNFPGYNVDLLCQKLNYSRMQLTRLMKQYFNTTPHEYLLDYKLNYAENLLITSDIKIATISEILGYSSQSTFIKNFEEKYGMSPKKYREKLVETFSK